MSTFYQKPPKTVSPPLPATSRQSSGRSGVVFAALRLLWRRNENSLPRSDIQSGDVATKWKWAWLSGFFFSLAFARQIIPHKNAYTHTHHPSNLHTCHNTHFISSTWSRPLCVCSTAAAAYAYSQNALRLSAPLPQPIYLRPQSSETQLKHLIYEHARLRTKHNQPHQHVQHSAETYI